MKKFLIFFLFAPAFLFAQSAETEKGMHFEHTTFAEVLAKAKKENKMIFIDAYTTWCGPCKWMAKEVFTNDTAGDFYNKNFLNVKMDMEKGEGIEIRKRYNVNFFPTYLFLDNNGQLMHRSGGAMETKRFIELGMDAMNPAKQFRTYKAKYDAGNATADETGEYVLMLLSNFLPVKEEMEKYFSSQADADLIKQRNWEILYYNSHDMNIESREFKYLVAHKTEYEKLYTAESVNWAIKTSYYSTLQKFIRKNNNEKYNSVKAEIIKNNFSFSGELVAESDMSLYKSTKDWNSYAQAASNYIDKFKKEDYNTLNSIAWDFYENIEDKSLLAKAEGWAKHSVELKPEYFNYDTYAAILYKSGKKAEAKTAAEKAIELGKKAGEDYKATQELLDKINAAK